jgi:hypothetical protein
MPRGGRRSGTPGSAYAQRTDLSQPAQLPPAAATGQPYGQASQQIAAQQAVPIQSGPATPQAAPPETPQGPMPGELGAFHGPTTRPDEAVTHGLSVGPGAGPEALGGPAAPSPLLKGLALLNTMPNLPPELKAVQKFLAVSQNNGINQ